MLAVYDLELHSGMQVCSNSHILNDVLHEPTKREATRRTLALSRAHVDRDDKTRWVAAHCCIALLRLLRLGLCNTGTGNMDALLPSSNRCALTSDLRACRE